MDVKVAVCQKPPVLLDLKATMARALESLDEAVAEGANLIVFPEAFLLELGLLLVVLILNRRLYTFFLHLSWSGITAEDKSRHNPNT